MTLAAAQRAFVGLGANLGDARAMVRAALGELAGLTETRVAARSSIYRSAPQDAVGPDFFNAVAELRTRLEPLALLRQLQAIENRHGRVRTVRNAPRTLDLDLLLWSDCTLQTPELTLPHPRMHRRAFVLKPLAELAPDLVLPGHGAISVLLAGLADQSVEPVTSR